MLKYFIIFTALGFLIGKVPSRGVAFFYIAFISVFWGSHTEVIWGLAASGELLLGYFIGATFQSGQRPPSSRQAPPQRFEPALDDRSSREGQITNRLIEPSSGLASLASFKAKTLEVLKCDLDYFVATPGLQQELFDKVTRTARELGINEYDAAIAFMLLQLKALSRPLSTGVVDFYAEKLSKCMRLVPKSKGALELVRIFVVDHRSDFTPHLLARPEMAFATGILEEEDDEPPPVYSKYRSDSESRLREIISLKEKGLISTEQYEAKAKEIIRDL